MDALWQALEQGHAPAIKKLQLDFWHDDDGWIARVGTLIRHGKLPKFTSLSYRKFGWTENAFSSLVEGLQAAVGMKLERCACGTYV